MPNYVRNNAMKIVRTTHVVQLFERDCAATILEVLKRVPPKARITDMGLYADNASAIRIEFIEETAERLD